MKKNIASVLLPMVLFVVMLNTGCKKENSSTVPRITTSAVSNIGITSAIFGGQIISSGGALVTEQGVCWSTTANPTTSDLKKTDTSGSKVFTFNITSLTSGTTYHVRAYATNYLGTSYGKDITFTTQTVSTLTTTAISNVSISGATSGGTITSDGGASITAKGVCWSTETDPTTANSKTTDGTGSDSYVSNITGLSAGTLYHVRAYATNSAGTSYGQDFNFTTNAVTLTTTEISSISTSSATSGGTITNDGGATITAKGVCWSTTLNPTLADSKTTNGEGSTSFVSNITNLLAGTSYHVRAYASYSGNTSYGDDIIFTTGKSTPALTTTPALSFSMNSISIGGTITNNGGDAITAKGVCWSTSADPSISDLHTTDGIGSDNFVSYISSLTPSTTYHIRAYAVNAIGIAYGNDVSVTTSAPPADNDHLLLGNPSGAIPSILSPGNYLMVKPQYILSYSSAKRTMNWTSWHLFSGDFGSAARQDDFRADATLPSGWYQVTQYDYSFATYGFERGHMCPSADRTSSVSNNSATFLMTNMIPQAPNNNGITWGGLEDYTRTLVNAGSEVYIIAGPNGQGGTSAVGTFNTVNASVIVPAFTWKVVVVLSNGNDDINRITTTTRVIAVKMPNSQSIGSDWKAYRVSVDALETLTGYDFLSNVPTGVQDVIEASVDNL